MSSSTLSRQIWITWLAWIIVCATIPVINATFAAAMSKEVRPSDPNAIAIRQGLIWLVVVTAILPPVLEWLVLRRIAPKLGLETWSAMAVVAGGVWFCIMSGAFFRWPGGFQWSANLSYPSRIVRMAWAEQRMLGDPTIGQFITLPWHRLVLSSIASTAMVYTLPIVVLAHRGGGGFWILWTAAMAGAIASSSVDALYHIADNFRLGADRELNGISWTARFIELAYRVGAGATWGAVSGIVYILVSARTKTTQSTLLPTPTPWRVLAAVVAIAIAAAPPLMTYATGPKGWVAGFPALRRTLTLAPREDSYQGEALLMYSHRTDLAVHAYPNAMFSPDGTHLAVTAANHSVADIDARTGHQLGIFGDVPIAFERTSWMWTPDSRYLILRSWGSNTSDQSWARKNNETRLRIFDRESHHPISDWESGDSSCGDSYASPSMLVDAGAQSFWILCGRSVAPRPDDALAIHLSLPSLKKIGEAHYGDTADTGESRGLVAIDGRPVSWHAPPKGDRIFLVDLQSGALAYKLVDLDAPDRGASMTFQTSQTVFARDRTVLRYCGLPTNTLPKEDRKAILAAINHCRNLTFNLQTGALLDVQETDRMSAFARSAIEVGGRRLLVATKNDPASKTGFIIVKDADNGRELQRITTAAQEYVAASPDGRNIVTREVDSAQLRFYRID